MKPKKCICRRKPSYGFDRDKSIYVFYCPGDCTGTVRAGFIAMGSTKKEAVEIWNDWISRRMEHDKMFQKGERIAKESATCNHIYGYEELDFSSKEHDKVTFLHNEKEVYKGDVLGLRNGLVKYEYCPLCGKDLEVYHVDPSSAE